MTKKHFIALANVLKGIEAQESSGRDSYDDGLADGAAYQYQATIDALADFCQSQNPRFYRARWLAYIAGECGPNGGRK